MQAPHKVRMSPFSFTSDFAFPPATEQELHETETILGFRLPPLLRALYAHLGNGGFGGKLGAVFPARKDFAPLAHATRGGVTFRERQNVTAVCVREFLGMGL